MDIKIAFLIEFLEKNSYIVQQRGFEVQGEYHKVCKLKRSIYSLKQALRTWNICFDDVVKSFYFIRNENEPYVYKKVNGSTITFLVLYIGVILLIRYDVKMMTSIKTWLSNTFSMKDLGEITYILGIHIYRDRERRLMDLSQALNIERS